METICAVLHSNRTGTGKALKKIVGEPYLSGDFSELIKYMLDPTKDSFNPEGYNEDQRTIADKISIPLNKILNHEEKLLIAKLFYYNNKREKIPLNNNSKVEDYISDLRVKATDFHGDTIGIKLLEMKLSITSHGGIKKPYEV